MQQKWPEPAWITALPCKERGAERVRFFLRLAAVYHSPNGTLTALSESLGFSKPYLNVAWTRGKVSPELAVRIESLLGRERFPRELFNDIFAVSE